MGSIKIYYIKYVVIFLIIFDVSFEMGVFTSPSHSESFALFWAMCFKSTFLLGLITIRHNVVLLSIAVGIQLFWMLSTLVYFGLDSPMSPMLEMTPKNWAFFLAACSIAVYQILHCTILSLPNSRSRSRRDIEEEIMTYTTFLDNQRNDLDMRMRQNAVGDNRINQMDSYHRNSHTNSETILLKDQSHFTNDYSNENWVWVV